MEVEIREYSKSDWSNLVKIADGDEDWSEAIRRLMLSTLLTGDNSTVRTIVAISESSVVGFIQGYVLPNKVLLPQIMYVKSTYRENGIAHQLMEELEKTSQCSISLIYYNKSLHEFYKQQGYITGENHEVAIKDL